MCNEQILIPKMMEFNDKKRRRKSKFRNILRTLLSRSTDMDRQWLVYEPIKNSNLKRTIFILTALIAFILGLSVGVLIPFVILPKINLSLNDTTSNLLVYDHIIDTIRDDNRVTSSHSNNTNSSSISSQSSSNTSVNSSNPNSFSSNSLHNFNVPNGSREVHPYNLKKPFLSVSFVSNLSGSVRPSVYQRLSTQHGTSSTEIDSVSSLSSTTKGGLLDGIFWSEEIEATLPRGYDESDADRWRRFLRSAEVSKLEQGCGRMQNRLVTFHDGSKACVRYRQNTDQIQGELFSFYLGRILNMNNLAPSSLSSVRTTSNLWKNVKPQILLAQWMEDRPIILTKYIDNLRPANIPKHFQSNSRRLHPIDLKTDEENLIELVQWSDLIIFDYLTANLDRIVNNLYNLQWNPGMMEAPAHNLAKNTNNDLLLFLDNESGLLHGYRLLDKYEAYHSVLLEGLCIFRKPTVKILERLRDEKNVGAILNENLFDFNDREILPVLPEKSIKILNERIKKVLDQVSWCQTQYTDSSNNVR